MSWIARIFKGSELDRARRALEDARERSEQDMRELERWCAALGAGAPAKAAAAAHASKATAAAAEQDLAGVRTALEQYELTRTACAGGRAELARAHPRAAGLLLLADASAASGEIRDDEDRSAYASHVGAVQARSGDVTGARATLERVVASVDRAHVLRAIAITRATPEAVAEYRDEIAALPDLDPLSFDPEEVVPSIVEELCRRADVTGASALAATLVDPEWKAHALVAIATAEAHAGRLAEARALAESITESGIGAAAWSAIAIAQANAGDSAGALHTAEGIADERARWNTLSGIAGVLADKGRDEDALALAETIENPDARDDAIAAIADARATRRDYGAAFETLGELQSPGLRAQKLVKLAAALQVAGEREQADTMLAEAFGSLGAGLSSSQMPFHLASLLVFARTEVGELDAAEAVVATVADERGRAELLGVIAHHALRSPTSDLAALEGLLARHPGPLERMSILEHAANALLARATPAAASGRDTAPETA